MAGIIDFEVQMMIEETEQRGACIAVAPDHQARAAKVRENDGLLVNPFPRLYARTEAWEALKPDERERYIINGLRDLHSSWVFCGISAAVMLGLSVSYHLMGTVEVVSRDGGHRLHKGLVKERRVKNDEPISVGWVRVTSPLRTVFDCIRTVPFVDGVAIADSAIRQGYFSHDELVAYVAKMKRYPGVKRARVVANLADGNATNGGESIAFATMYLLGFELPRQQVAVHDPLQPWHDYIVDYLWELPDGRQVAGELDGGIKYTDSEMNGGSPEAARQRERIRESRITAGQMCVVRFSMSDVRNLGYFESLLGLYGIPRNDEPEIP